LYSNLSHVIATSNNESLLSELRSIVLDYAAGVARFGNNRSKLVPELALPQRVGTLTAFMIQYNYAADLLEQFIPLCELLLDPALPKNEEKTTISS
jgi:hypothetical protein